MKKTIDVFTCDICGKVFNEEEVKEKLNTFNVSTGKWENPAGEMGTERPHEVLYLCKEISCLQRCIHELLASYSLTDAEAFMKKMHKGN